jgi:hypothetical protein
MIYSVLKLILGAHRAFAMIHGGMMLTWIGNTVDDHPTRDVVVFRDGFALYDGAAREFVASKRK